MINAAIPASLWQDRLSTTAFGAFDRLSLLTLISGLYFFQVWGMSDFGSPMGDALRYALIALSCAAIVLPRLHASLLINAGAFILYYLANSPIASNNQLTAFAVSLVVLCAAAAVLIRPQPKDESGREALFQAIAGPGRWILAAMYFYGIYHKINADFLTPQVSCAAVLYDALATPFGLNGWSVGQYGAIYATFIIEGVAMIALFTPRWKRLGMLIGIPFHIIIGWTGYAYYKDFSTIVLFLYALFLPRVALVAAMDAAAERLGGKARAARIGLTVLAGGLLAYFAATGAIFDLSRLQPSHEGFFIAFTLYAIAFYAFVVLFVPPQPDQQELGLISRPAWLMVIPALYFLNGLSPYLGLKTESSIAMYSNLHTEAGQTNHLLHGQLPFAFNYQNDIVTPLSSNSPEFNAQYVGEGRALVRFEFDRLLAESPGLLVRFRHDGIVHTNDILWTNSYLAASPLERKFLRFKPIDSNRPKVCTH